jgi:hypothetical protein
MKSVIVAAVLGGILFGVVTVVLIQGGAGPLARSKASPEIQRLAAEVEALSDGVAGIAARVETVERLVREELASADPNPLAHAEPASPIAAAAGRRSAEAAPTSALAALAGSEGDDGLPISQEPAPALETTSSPELRQFVARVIEEEREERERRRAEEARERARSYRELREGPYGKYNYKVNSLARSLDLTDAQRQYYYDLLTQYDGRMKNLRSEIDWKVDGAPQTYRDQRNAVEQEFQQAVRLSLSPEQRDAYEEVPVWQRTLGGSGVQVWSRSDGPSQVSTFVVGGGETATDVILGDGGVAVPAGADPPGPVGIQVQIGASGSSGDAGPED